MGIRDLWANAVESARLSGHPAAAARKERREKFGVMPKTIARVPRGAGFQTCPYGRRDREGKSFTQIHCHSVGAFGPPCRNGQGPYAARGTGVKISPNLARGVSRQACRVGCQADFSKADRPKGPPVGPAGLTARATGMPGFGVILMPMAARGLTACPASLTVPAGDTGTFCLEEGKQIRIDLFLMRRAHPVRRARIGLQVGACDQSGGEPG